MDLVASSGPGAPGMHAVHKHIYKKNTHADLKEEI